jgi:hypothetical protein
LKELHWAALSSWVRFRDATQKLTGVCVQGIDEDLLHMTLDILVTIHAATPLCGSDVNPVCRAVAGAGKTLRIDEGFEQQRADLIDAQPIFGQLLRDHGKDLTGKPRNFDPREDKETAIAHDSCEVEAPDLILPSNPSVPWGHFPSGAGKEQTSQDTRRQALAADEVTKLSAERDAVAKVMVTLDVLSEESAARSVGDEIKLERCICFY